MKAFPLLRRARPRIHPFLRVLLLAVGLATVAPGNDAAGTAGAYSSPALVVAGPRSMTVVSRPHGPTDTRAFLGQLKLINYFPAHGGWSFMWQRWDAATLDADFARIAALHANTVRLILQAATFGYPSPAPAMQARLARTVALAQAHGLRVQLTLFDWWYRY